MIALGLEPVQASETANSAIFDNFSLNSSSLMPNSCKVLGIFNATLYSSIFLQSFTTHSESEPLIPTLLAIAAYLSFAV